MWALEVGELRGKERERDVETMGNQVKNEPGTGQNLITYMTSWKII